MRLKRVFDLAGAAGGLVFFLPVMMLVAVAIVLDDGLPLVFRQERLGRGRRRFTILKFRSMRDGRVTRAGRVLRATGLDELPQFINVLRGEMSAVGPRPLTEGDVARLGWSARRYDDRWRVPPGLTGLAQLVGSNTSRVSLFLDRTYIARPSVWLDIRLIAASFAVNALGKRRVRELLIRRSRSSRVRLRTVGRHALPSPLAHHPDVGVTKCDRRRLPLPDADHT
jgi:lipopolysaccharide/colanic/teichoic acid biosynthesis glycosyltransferase